jgi:hypothetical protein
MHAPQACVLLEFARAVWQQEIEVAVGRDCSDKDAFIASSCVRSSRFATLKDK